MHLHKIYLAAATAIARRVNADNALNARKERVKPRSILRAVEHRTGHLSVADLPLHMFAAIGEQWARGSKRHEIPRTVRHWQWIPSNDTYVRFNVRNDVHAHTKQPLTVRLDDTASARLTSDGDYVFVQLVFTEDGSPMASLRVTTGRVAAYAWDRPALQPDYPQWQIRGRVLPVYGDCRVYRQEPAYPPKND